MALFDDHDWINFDALQRTRKADTVLSLIKATENAGDLTGEERKDFIAEVLKNAYVLFIGKSGTYDGSRKKFQKQYTIGLELGIWKDTESYELNDYAKLVGQNKISIEKYFDRVFLNYFQIINSTFFHPLYCITKYLIKNKKTSLTRQEISDLVTDLTKSAVEEEKKNEDLTALIRLLLSTSYFRSDDENLLVYSSQVSLENLNEMCDISYSDKSQPEIKAILSDRKTYSDYLIHEKKVIPKQGEIKMTKPFTPLNYKPLSKESKTKEYNRIIFGAPGTGKSYELNKYVDSAKPEFTFDKAHFERVTFHPEYSYAQFVGCYKPVSDGNNISYEYVPGPFMRTLVASLESGKNGTSAEKFLLIVEEINRAKVAAVFGDMFQLLDRTAEGDSEYEIQASEDVRRYLAKKLGGVSDDYKELKLPNNFYIWATMNSADQGVQPMDTAFKRRWEGYEYLGINDNDRVIKDVTIPLPINGSYELFNWNNIRRELNKKLKDEANVNEDKLMGPFFISKHTLDEYNGKKDKGADFSKLFKSKILMYLFEDAAKMAHSKIFPSEGIKQHYSDICEKFDKDGLGVFGLKADDFKAY